MKQINERYWNSRFARFVKNYGVDELAMQLDASLCGLPLDSRRDHSAPSSRGDYPASRP